ncbi:MAG: S8 family serine peptidase [Planctomycetota bacterium]
MVFSVRYGGREGKKYSFGMSSDMLAIRYDKDQSFERLVRSTHSRSEVSTLQEVARFDDANVVVMRVPPQRGVTKARDAARSALKPTGARFVGRVLQDPKSKRPVLYTENYFVRFMADESNRKCKQILKQMGLKVKKQYEAERNTFFVEAKEGLGSEKIFAIGEKLLDHDSVELCHPELVRERSLRAANKNQWHLKKATIDGKTVNAHANVEEAWSLSRGKGVTICVIDDGVDVEHQDFSRTGKVVHGRDVTEGSNNPRPKVDAFPMLDIEGDAHGTCCAGVACASGSHSASGVAPDAKLLPIRFASGLGSNEERDAFLWAADHGADVISCSWGPRDGAWFDPSDPLHNQVTPLPDSTRTALEHATQNGRGGKGCVITWAAGNGNESADNDGYASSDMVMAVAACNDRGTKSVYSDFGNAVWCSFPSSNFKHDGLPDPLTPGIWTTDRSDGTDEGYNPFFSGGDAAKKYTDGFGGTSSACPGVAGVAALIIAQNPHLNWIEVSNIIADTCDQIDKTNGDYDPDTGHSPIYGFGRVNAKKAVEKAKSLLGN